MLEESKRDREQTRLAQERDQYLRAMQNIPMINGDEGRSFLSTYFRTFEDTTALWDDRLRASLLSSRLHGPAKLQFDALSVDAQTSYQRVKSSLLHSGINPQSIRANAQAQLMSGLSQGEEESFLEFGKRLLRVTRDSLHTDATENVIEEQATGYLLSYIRDSSVRNVVASLRLKCNYHELLDRAVALMKLNMISRPRRNDNPLPASRVDDRHRNQSPQQNKPHWKSSPRQEYSAHQPYRRPVNNRNVFTPINVANHGNGANSRVGPKPQNGRQVNAAQAEPAHDSLENTIQGLARDSDVDRDEYTRCGAIVGTSMASQDNSVLVPLRTPTKRGLTHAIIDPSGEKMPIHIGLSRGPSASESLNLFGIGVESLLDAGANVSLINKECLATVTARKGVDLKSLKLHPSPYNDCKAANPLPTTQ